jgi:hypothetical protein
VAVFQTASGGAAAAQINGIKGMAPANIGEWVGYQALYNNDKRGITGPARSFAAGGALGNIKLFRFPDIIKVIRVF